MRISVNSSDPGYRPWAMFCKVYLNGEEVKNFVTADEEKGVVHCYTVDKDGRFQFEFCYEHNIKTEKKYGIVKISVPDSIKE